MKVNRQPLPLPCPHYAFLLNLALAFNVFHAFWSRNLKPQLRERHTKIHWANLIEATFRVLLAPELFLHPP